MLRMKLLTIIVMATIAISGCVAVGGSKKVGVLGALPETAGKCLLEFVSADTGRTKMKQPVQGNFCSGVVVGGGFAQKYYFVARCPDGSVYRSQASKIGMADDVIHVDLSLANGGN